MEATGSVRIIVADQEIVMKRPFEKLTDGELMQRSIAGDEAAFPEIVSRHKNSLYAFLNRFLNQSDLVDDVFQETFLQLFTSRESFDPSRPLRPWLFTIAANKAKDALAWQSLMKEELGDEWLMPDLFRIGASSLLTDLERQLYHYITGHYAARHHMPMG